MEHEHHQQHEDHEQHQDSVDHSGHELIFRRKFWISLVLSIPVLLYSGTVQEWLGFSMPSFAGSQWIVPIFSLVIFLVGGIPFLKMALPELRKREPGMMTLISLAITVALVYSVATMLMESARGFFWELVTLIDVMLLGHWIEMRSVRQASGSLDELASLMPDKAELVKDDGSTEEVDAGELNEGDLILVRPGESVPADGEIEEGESKVNESMITGESTPVRKSPGDEVIGGSINGDGSLRIRISATGDETALAGIMRLVKEARESKSKTQLLADRAAGWLFYIALGVAVLTGAAWILAVGFQVEVVARVATVLVIACPHALGLAVPLVVAKSTSLAAGSGILVRDRLALEESRSLNTIIFDKTGTLTKGEFGVTGIEVTEDWSEQDALALTVAVEGDSEHTIARGLRKTAEERDVDKKDVSSFEAIKGRGVKAEFEGRNVYVGGPRLLEMLEVELDESLRKFTDKADEEGQSVVYLVLEDQAAAGFSLADVVREESREAVKILHEMGLEVAMLTGDSEHVARAVAGDLDIDRYYAEVLPEDKDQKVKELQSQGKKVAMVGDGVNDAPALARADVGIAIGSGTDVAVDSAGIILVKSNPLDVVKLINLSKVNHRKMVQNLWWAAGYNIFALPLAAGVLAPVGILLSPAAGALLMSLSTVIVAVNARIMKID